MEVINNGLERVHECFLIDISNSATEIVLQVLRMAAEHDSGQVAFPEAATVVLDEIRMWVCGKTFHGTGLLQKALGEQVDYIVSFIHIVLGNVGSLDEDLNIGRELPWRRSKLFGVRQGQLWEYLAVRDWLERGRDLLERDLSFAGR